MRRPQVVTPPKKRVKVPRTMEKHHRRCRSNGGNNSERNISLVEQGQHRAYHTLFQNRTAAEIARVLNDVWIDPDWYLVAFPRRRKKPKPARKRRYCTDCSCEVLKYIAQTSKEET